jgi:XTP/dITP diphosphohydrolase
MRREIIFASNNDNKIKELNQLLKDSEINLLGLKDINCKEELPENQETLEGNALEKASYLHQHYKTDCFADDTGLEITALGGKPGVYSARYAGLQRSAEDNMNKVLDDLKNSADRSAQFRTVIALIISEKEYFFEGIVKGNIAHSKMGNEGFGYDPVFIPEGYNKSFAEMTMEEKNKISHRAIAVGKLIEFLSQK